MVSLAIPLMRCMKFKAIRSALRMPAAEPRTTAISIPGERGEPS